MCAAPAKYQLKCPSILIERSGATYLKEFYQIIIEDILRGKNFRKNK